MCFIKVYYLKSARLFRYERLKCAIVLGSAAHKYRKRSTCYGEELKASIRRRRIACSSALQ